MLTWKDMETLYERLEADDCIGVYIEIKQYAQHYLKDRQECQRQKQHVEKHHLVAGSYHEYMSRIWFSTT